MSELVYSWQFTVPAGTQPGTPASFAMQVSPQLVQAINVRVPPGPHGCVGFQVDYGGGQAFPYGLGSWMVADDSNIITTPPADLTSGAWKLIAYNTGTYDHTLYVTMSVAAGSSTQTSGVTMVTPFYIT
jgi:hypothetical protein